MSVDLSIEPAAAGDVPVLVELWEASVRATHHFLSEADLQYFKQRIASEYFPQVSLSVARGRMGRVLGFVGVADAKIEMLFVHPDRFGQGVGGMLLQHAISQGRATAVDVNEQNTQALVFYQRRGFRVRGRSPEDSTGKPYPLLHLELTPRGHGFSA